MDLEDTQTVDLRLQRWVDSVCAVLMDLHSTMAPAHVAQLKSDLSARLSAYRDPASTPDESIPSVNVGASFCVVGMNALSLARSLASTPNGSDVYLHVVRVLRRFCVRYGASLVVSPSHSDVPNTVLQDVLFHTLYAFPCTHTVKDLASLGDCGVYVPAGYDSVSLIETVVTGPIADGDCDPPLSAVFSQSLEAVEAEYVHLVQSRLAAPLSVLEMDTLMGQLIAQHRDRNRTETTSSTSTIASPPSSARLLRGSSVSVSTPRLDLARKVSVTTSTPVHAATPTHTHTHTYQPVTTPSTAPRKSVAGHSAKDFFKNLLHRPPVSGMKSPLPQTQTQTQNPDEPQSLLNNTQQGEE